LYLSERNIYGSSRLGMENIVSVIASSNATNIEAYAHEKVVVGDKAFELSNHLGNFNDTWVLSNKTLSGINPVRNLSEATGVLNTITDKKLPEFDATTGDLAFFNAVVVGYSDYYPFGMQRISGGTLGRYGFNGMESIDEVSGAKNSYDFGARLYNPRIGRWLSIDPLARKFPFLSPYNFVANNPIFFVDPNGEDIGESNKYKGDKNAQSATKLAHSNDLVKNLFDLFAKQNSGLYKADADGKLSNHDLYFGTEVGQDSGLTKISVWNPNKEIWEKLKNTEKQIVDANFKVRLEIHVEVIRNEDYDPSQVGENLNTLVHELYVHANNAVKILSDWENSGKSTEDLAKLKSDLSEWVKSGSNGEHYVAANNENDIFTDVSKSFMKQLWTDFSNESDVGLKSDKREIYSRFVGRLVSETERGGSDAFENEIRAYDAELKAENPE
jgi:RHS repeat-associated protein